MILTVENVSCAYRQREVLHEVSFSLAQGQVLCVLGPNGVGKSTLFRCVLGLKKPSGGRIRIDDTEIQRLSPREMARRIAYIPQFSEPAFRYTVLDLVLMGTTAGLKILASPGEKERKAAYEALDRLGIAYLADRTADTLSGGERQMVLIARALAQKTPLLVMDEPTASLDYGNGVRVMEMVCSLAEDGYGIMLSTHDPDQVLRYGSQALVLGAGRVRSFGPPETALTSEVLSDIYRTPIEIVSLPADNGPHRVCVPTGRIEHTPEGRPQ